MTQTSPVPLNPYALSPCTGVCRLDPSTGYCLGCLRTGTEIASWTTYSEAERWAMLRTLKARKAAGAKVVRPDGSRMGV